MWNMYQDYNNFIESIVAKTSPEIANLIKAENLRENETVELIASENFPSPAVMAAQGSCLVSKYSEGYAKNRPDCKGNFGRYYGGCEVIDQIEEKCCQLFKKLFNTDYHVNVQPHSGSQANYAAYMAILKPGDTILSFTLNNGGHLTHGSEVNFSGKLYNFVFYDVDKNGLIDMEDVRQKALKYKPKLIMSGYSAYSRLLDYKKFREIADEVGAYLMTDMAHIAGLIATGEIPSPFGICDIITSTTHKTLRGPRGGIIFCKPELAKKIDSAVFPGSQGGPLEHIIAAKAICAIEALRPEFKDYIHQVVVNCKAMCNEFIKMGYKVVTGGTDNHLFLLDLSDKGITGLELQELCDKNKITLNKNCIPDDKQSPKITSGVRIGTAAMTTKGYKEEDFIKVAHKINDLIKEFTKNA